jgi:hypothetical protein
MLTLKRMVTKISTFYESLSSLPCAKATTTASILSQINPIHTIISHCSRFYFNIIPLRLGLPRGQYFQLKFYMHFSFLPWPVHLILLDVIILIIYGEKLHTVPPPQHFLSPKSKYSPQTSSSHIVPLM